MSSHPFLRYKWVTQAAIGLILFLVTNWLPAGSARDGTRLSSDSDQIIYQEQAALAAMSWIIRQQSGGTEATFTHYPVSFQANTILSGYLQKNELVQDYATRYIDTYPIEYWQVEWRNPTGTAYLLDVDMEKGTVLGWYKNTAGTTPPREEGQNIAEAYLKANNKLTKGYSVEGPDSKHPERYVFTIPAEKSGEAVLKLKLEVRGNEVASYHAAFQVPGSHLAWLNEQDAASGSMSRWNLIITAIMAVTALVVLIRYRKRFGPKRGIGLALAFLALYLLNNWNQMPAFQAMGYSESANPFNGHAAAALLTVIYGLFTFALGLVTYFSLSAGDTLWKLRGTTKWPKWNESSFGRETLRAMGRGYGLAMFMIGAQAVILWVAQVGFGMWSVNDPSSSYYNFLHPGWFPLMAWTAAISEEAIYRLFGIALFQRLIRNNFIAVLAPSLIWAFNHTLYPIYPVYTRLIEVTLLGLVFGYALLKYGFLTALFAHAIIDSTLMGLPLIGWMGVGYTAAGILYILSPALVGVFIWLLHGLLIKAPPGSSLHPEAR